MKFINAILNSSTIINYIKDNKFNSLSGTKLKELKIPKINFSDEEQVKKYNRVVELADKLIEIYSDKDSEINDLVIKKEGAEIVENGSEEFNKIMNSKDFEIEDDILFIIKVGGVEYFGFDELKEKLISGKQENNSIGEILGLNSEDNNKEIEKLNKEIDELAKWFYYENNSVPEGYVEEERLF